MAKTNAQLKAEVLKERLAATRYELAETVRKWKLWADGQEKLLDDKRDEVRALEKQVTEDGEARGRAEEAYEKLLVAVVMRELGLAGIPRVLQMQYIGASIDTSMVVDNYSYLATKPVELLEDFWLWVALTINETEGELPEKYYLPYI